MKLDVELRLVSLVELIPKDRLAAILLKNSVEAVFWRVACMHIVIDGGAHHDGSDGFAGSTLLRVQSC